MTENEGRGKQPPGAEPSADDELGEGDLGEPIAELQGMEEDVSTGFLSRVLSKLRRRSLVGHFATMAWTASALAFFEFLGMIFSIFDHGKTREKEGPTDG
jgi:hypothetical protein